MFLFKESFSKVYNNKNLCKFLVIYHSQHQTLIKQFSSFLILSVLIHELLGHFLK